MERLRKVAKIAIIRIHNSYKPMLRSRIKARTTTCKRKGGHGPCKASDGVSLNEADVLQVVLLATVCISSPDDLKLIDKTPAKVRVDSVACT